MPESKSQLASLVSTQPRQQSEVKRPQNAQSVRGFSELPSSEQFGAVLAAFRGDPQAIESIRQVVRDPNQRGGLLPQVTQALQRIHYQERQQVQAPPPEQAPPYQPERSAVPQPVQHEESVAPPRESPPQSRQNQEVRQAPRDQSREVVFPPPDEIVSPPVTLTRQEQSEAGVQPVSASKPEVTLPPQPADDRPAEVRQSPAAVPTNPGATPTHTVVIPTNFDGTRSVIGTPGSPGNIGSSGSSPGPVPQLLGSISVQTNDVPVVSARQQAKVPATQVINVIAGQEQAVGENSAKLQANLVTAGGAANLVPGQVEAKLTTATINSQNLGLQGPQQQANIPLQPGASEPKIAGGKPLVNLAANPALAIIPTASNPQGVNIQPELQSPGVTLAGSEVVKVPNKAVLANLVGKEQAISSNLQINAGQLKIDSLNPQLPVQQDALAVVSQLRLLAGEQPVPTDGSTANSKTLEQQPGTQTVTLAALRPETVQQALQSKQQVNGQAQTGQQTLENFNIANQGLTRQAAQSVAGGLNPQNLQPGRSGQPAPVGGVFALPAQAQLARDAQGRFQGSGGQTFGDARFAGSTLKNEIKNEQKTVNGIFAEQVAANAGKDKVANLNQLPRPTTVNEVPGTVAKAALQAQKGGDQTIQLRLRPAELGQLEIRFEFEKDGSVRVMVRTERPETLELLQRDRQEMVQKLQDSGFDCDQECLEFSLSQQGSGNADESDPEPGKAAQPDALPSVKSQELDITPVVIENNDDANRLNVIV